MKLLEPSEAIELVYKVLGRSLVERILADTTLVEISDLHGRLIAESIKARISLPPTLKSTLDGYAVSTSDLIGASKSNPVRLKLSGYSRIGDSRLLRVKWGECIQVDTGATVPLGADAVVPLEDVVVDGDYVLFTYTPQPGSGLAFPASDVALGDIIVPRGSRGYPEVVAALASQGYRFVKASRRPRIAIFSNGDELVEPGSSYKAGVVFESNRFYLSTVLKTLGYEVIDLGIIPDDIETVRDVMHRGAEVADIVVSSGGTSIGLKDYVYRVLESDGRVVIRGLRVKPGKPTIVGLMGGALFVGIPGNPRATVNITWSFLIPLLDRLGLPAYQQGPVFRDVMLAQSVRLDRRRRLNLPLALVKSSKGFLGFPVAVESYMIAGLPKADSIAELESGDIIEAGSIVKALSYRYPEPSLLALTDTNLVDLGDFNKRILVSIVEDASWILEALRGADIEVLLSTLQLGNVQNLNATITWSSRRRILLVGVNNCKRTAIFKPYAKLYKEGLLVDRAETAKMLLEQGYVDCSIIPEDYKPQGFNIIEELGLEELMIMKLT